MTIDLAGPTSHAYFSQRLRLNYVDWGNDDAPPLLLVHGGRDHCRNWDWVAAELRRDYHIIAPDLRGHGDSQWALGSSYVLADFVYDIAQLTRQKQLAPVSIISHSLGGAISLLYSGTYPETVRRLAVIEGWLPPLKEMEQRRGRTQVERMTGWIDQLRNLSARAPRRYPTIEDAFRRMRDENPRLTEEQARHLTVHGVNQNEDGTFSWKFDNYVRAFAPYGLSREATDELWSRIACPTLLVRGAESWMTDLADDPRLALFQQPRVVNFDSAGHWVHHDKLDEFLPLVRDFLR